MNSASEIYKKSYLQALEDNKNTIDRINDFEKELVAVKSILEENQKSLHVNVIVPLCSKAMIKGKLVHTSELYVNLGDKWFLKTSCFKALDICERMIERCHRNIREFTKESKLLDSNLKMLDEIEVFPDETLKDIVEPYDEEYEAHWREEHNNRVREHRRQAMNLELSDEVLFTRLDQLEAKETELETRDESSPEKRIPHQVLKSVSKEKESEIVTDVSLGGEKNNQTVSFMDGDISSDFENCGSKMSHETFVIYFKHSDQPSKSHHETLNREQMLPNDTLRPFVNQSSLEGILEDNANVYHRAENERNYSRSTNENANLIGDIVEKATFNSEKLIQEARPSSKFKRNSVL